MFAFQKLELISDRLSQCVDILQDAEVSYEGFSVISDLPIEALQDQITDLKRFQTTQVQQAKAQVCVLTLILAEKL